MITREKERRSMEQSGKDFETLKNMQEFTADDQEHLVLDIIDLVGWYRIDQNNELKILIDRMISFGESKQWSMAGVKLALEHAKAAGLNVKQN